MDDLDVQIIAPPPRQHFRMAPGIRWGLLLITAALVAAALWLVFYYSAKAFSQNSFSPLAIVVLGVGYLSFFAYGAWATARSSLQIQQDLLLCTEAFTQKKLSLDDLAGYRTDETHTYLYSAHNPDYRLKISRFVSGYADLHKWLAMNFANLDVVQALEEEENLLHDPYHGRSVEEREAKLHEARKVAKLLNVTGVVLSIWLFILGKYPQYYALSLAVAVLFPWCLVLVLWYYKGLMGLHDQQEGKVVRSGPLPSIMTALLFPPLLLGFRTFFDYQVLHYGPLWLPALALAGLLAIALFACTYSLKKLKSARYGLYATILVASLSYGYGAAFLTNCLYDTASPTPYQAQVMDKRISKGKASTYYLTLSPWGTRKTAEELKVSGQLHTQLAVGDTVQLRLYPGWLQAPWYTLQPLQ